MQLMAGWLYIIKQAAGDVPEETAPAKTHSLNTMFQEAITHRVPEERHPEEGLQLLPPCLSCLAVCWFSCRKLECAGPGAPTSFIYPGSTSCTVSPRFEAPVSTTGGANTSSLDWWSIEALICSRLRLQKALSWGPLRLIHFQLGLNFNFF